MTAEISVVQILALPIIFSSPFNEKTIDSQREQAINQPLCVKLKIKNTKAIHKFTLDKSQLPQNFHHYFVSSKELATSRIYSKIESKESISIKGPLASCMRYTKGQINPKSGQKREQQLLASLPIRLTQEEDSTLQIWLDQIQQSQEYASKIQDILKEQQLGKKIKPNQGHNKQKIKQSSEGGSASYEQIYGKHEILQIKAKGVESDTTQFSEERSNTKSIVLMKEEVQKLTGKQLITAHKNKLESKSQSQLWAQPHQEQYLAFMLCLKQKKKRYKVCIKYQVKYMESKIYCGGVTMSHMYSLAKLSNLDKVQKPKQLPKIIIPQDNEQTKTNTPTKQPEFIQIRRTQIISRVNYDSQIMVAGKQQPNPNLRRPNLSFLKTQEDENPGNCKQCCLFLNL